MRVERAVRVSGGAVDWVAVTVRSACSCLAAGQADIDVKKAPPQVYRVCSWRLQRWSEGKKQAIPPLGPLTRDHDDPASDRSGRHER